MGSAEITVTQSERASAKERSPVTSAIQIQVVVFNIHHAVVDVAIFVYLIYPLPPPFHSHSLPQRHTAMAIGKAAKWMPFATAPQTPASASVADDTAQSTVSIADEKQFGFENVRDLRLGSPPILPFSDVCLSNSHP